jgi:hypothetical protein
MLREKSYSIFKTNSIPGSFNVPSLSFVKMCYLSSIKP